MARSEKAERTYQQILEASTKLFFTQGYEKTSIQDILDEMKMSRGVVYYYFKSKKEILDAIAGQRLDIIRSFIKEAKAENAREKIAKVLSMIVDASDENEETLPFDHMADPHIVIANMHAQMNDAKLFANLLEEGIRDGSIKTEYPLQLAELMSMLLNTWLNPILFNRDLEQTKIQLKFIQQTLRILGADVIGDKMVDRVIENMKQMGSFN